MSTNQPLKITDVVLRDAHQSLFATRLRIEDMLPIAKELDAIGYWSLETWGGATFDACIRFLGEDPWERLRLLKEAMPNTKQQMLLRGQNILGYRHYADDLVRKFVQRACINGMDVFRIFDALNDFRNIKTAVDAVIKNGAHAQGTISYTISEVHTLDTWLSLARELEDMGCHSICIKDMAGLLSPYKGFELVTALKKTIKIPIAIQCHATTGLSMATYMKVIDAGIDMVDTSISSMSMTYGHSPTETVVSMLKDTKRDTKLELDAFEYIASYFKNVRKKYASFEGELKGVDARILTAQVPGGMLTNMESQLKAQNALDKLDDVLKEIPKVREDLGFIPLVTPTSQIVGTQAVLNVLQKQRYKTIAKETAGILKGEYGKTPMPVNKNLQKSVLEAGKEAITCRPADLIEPEFESLKTKLKSLSSSENFTIKNEEDDTLTYALFDATALKFLNNRDNKDAFEKVPTLEPKSKPNQTKPYNKETQENFMVNVDGEEFKVQIKPDTGEISKIKPESAPKKVQSSSSSKTIKAPLSGNILKIICQNGQKFQKGDVLFILEAMKMETEVKAQESGIIENIAIAQGAAVTVDQPLATFKG